MGRLERKLDVDLIARIEAGGKPKKVKQPRKNKPRKAETYRAARRNAAKGKVWKGIEPTRKQVHRIRLNRSRHLPPAASYDEARALSQRKAA